MKTLLCPSMMCADFSNLENEIRALETADIDIFHIDIMDGIYVPNFAMGLQDFELIRKKTTKMVDCHLMINNPGKYIDLFAERGANIIYFHPETEYHPARIIEQIRSKNVSPGIAISPNISISSIEPLLELVDYVLVMTVNPGFSGQKYLEFVNKKIKTLCDLKLNQNHSYKIIIDGAICQEKISELTTYGVDGFVLGTSALFGRGNYKNIIEHLRKL